MEWDQKVLHVAITESSVLKKCFNSKHAVCTGPSQNHSWSFKNDLLERATIATWRHFKIWKVFLLHPVVYGLLILSSQHRHVNPMGWSASKEVTCFFLAPKVQLWTKVELWDIFILFSYFIIGLSFLFEFYEFINSHWTKWS